MTLVLATLALSVAAFAQTNITQDGPYQVGYAANLNIGDSVVNLSNDGANGPFIGDQAVPTIGNICVNAYVFDPAEEEIACCYCLVTPNGLNSFSVDKSLAANPLTPATPTSVVIKLLASIPGTTGTASAPVLNTCNPAGVTTTYGATTAAPTLLLANGLLAWGVTLEPASTPGTYSPVNVAFLNAGTQAPYVLAQAGKTVAQTATSQGELNALIEICSFVQAEGTGFGVCKGCSTGALAGAKN